MNKKWVLPLFAFLLTACPDKETGISAINVTATPSTVASAGNSSLNAGVTGTGTFNQSVNWILVSGGGSLSSDTGTNVTYTAPTVTSQTVVQIKATAAGDPKFSQILAITVTAKTNPGGAIFTPTNAWTGDIPSDAQTLSQDEFSKGIESGELVLSSTASVGVQKQNRETTYQQDLTLLNNIPNKDPDTQTLLEGTASSPKFEGDLPVVQPNGETVVLFGLGTQVDNAAQAYQRSQSVENALSDYALSYSLLPDDLKAQAVTPDSLKGKSLTEVKVALKQIDDLLGTKPTALTAARLEPNIGIQPRAINPGNGTDNNGVCSPTNLVKRYWFPLKNFISPIKDQAKRGACWDFAAIGAVESRERVQNNNAVNLSEQFLMNKVKQDWDASDFTDGYWSEKALESAVDRGQVFPSEDGWTYNRASSRPSVKDGDSGSYANSCNGYSGTCSDTAHQSRRVCTSVLGNNYCSYVKVTFSGAGIASGRTTQIWKNDATFSFDLDRYRLYLAQGHVIMASFPVYRGFMDDVTNDGVVSNYSKTRFVTDDKGVKKEMPGSYGGHVVQIVGFLSNQDLAVAQIPANIGGGGYFIIKNSWGCKAGDGGYYYVPANYVSTLFSTLSVLNFDNRRSNAWNTEQATPGGSDAPKIDLQSSVRLVDLRVETDLAKFFKISHPVAKSVNLSVTSDIDGSLYNGAWSTDTNALFGSSLKRTFNTMQTRNLTLVAKYGTSQASATLKIIMWNTPPKLSLQYSGDPQQGEGYPISALITDINEPTASVLCANTTWTLDAPDTATSATGCSQIIKFGATGAREVRVFTSDSEGATDSQTLTLNVLPPPVNPYPRISSADMYARDWIGGGAILRRCTNLTVTGGNTINLTDLGCKLGISGPDLQRYFTKVTVENPDNEVLSYDWKLYVTELPGEKILYSADASASPIFDLYPWGNAILVTNNCRVTVTVNAPEASRSKSQTVWTGKCTYYATRLN